MLYPRYVKGASLEDAFRAYDVRYLIVDEHLSKFITDNPEDLTYYALYTMSKSALETLLEQRGQLVDSLDTDAYGTVQLYKLQWN